MPRIKVKPTSTTDDDSSEASIIPYDKLFVWRSSEQSPPPLSPPLPSGQDSKHMTISDDRSAGSNLEARNLEALKDRTASEQPEASNVEVLNEPVPTGFRRTETLHGPNRKEMPDDYSHQTFFRHPRMQQRFGQLRLREDTSLVDDMSSQMYDADKEAGQQHTTTGSSSIRVEPVEKSDWTESVNEIEPSSTNIEKLQEKITQMQRDLRNLQKLEERTPKKRYQVLYRLHGIRYLDHPEWTEGRTSVVSRIPLENLDLFLERNKTIRFIVYRNFGDGETKPQTRDDLRPKHITESIYLVDRLLRRVFQNLFERDWRYERDSRRLSEAGEMDAPYLFIYHHRKDWKNILSCHSIGVRDTLNILAAYVSKNYSREYMAVDALFARRKVSVESMKYLFQPGDILLQRTAGEYKGLIASSWPYEPSQKTTDEALDNTRFPFEKDEMDFLRLKMLESNFDESDESGGNSTLAELASLKVYPHANGRHRGRNPGPQSDLEATNVDKLPATQDPTKKFVMNINVHMWSFDGEFKREKDNVTLLLSPKASHTSEVSTEFNMHDLDVYPMQYAPKAIPSQLRQRGQMFWNCRKNCLVSYHQTVAEAQDESDERFMVDFLTFKKLHPANTSHIIYRPVETMSQHEMDQTEPPDEAFYYLAPLTTKGFNLRTKKWHDLNMSQVRPVVWNRQAFDSLVLDRKTKELITALVSKQILAAKSTDVVAGKGNGLILLLHGGPGTGKTLTAEGVAEIAKKPLYRVTCGDVGTKAEEVEKYLESVLHLGKLWDCVVLLDEAEVFLERRSLDDLQRNALVSVFLRVIEYHEGILILTSNRVGTFDEAFRSRIQIAVHYPPLRAYQRLQIWNNFFNRLESFKDGTVDVDGLRDQLEELQKIEINGRQIRNVITTARQYAEWKNEPMKYEHLQTALEVTGKFNEYSEKLRGGMTDDQIAQEDGIRWFKEE